MSKQYIHIWKDDNSEPLIQEHAPSADIDTAIDEYWQQENFFPYMHTIVLDSSIGTFQTINIESEIKEREEDDSEPYQYERLTGHEMGVCPGRV